MRTVIGWKSVLYESTGHRAEPDVNIITYFTSEEYIVEFKLRKFR